VRIGTKEVLLDTAELDLNNRGLEALPESIGELKALTKLDVGGNQLTKLPATIGNLTALKKLYVNHNQLQLRRTEAAFGIGTGQVPPDTVQLQLSGRGLKALAESIGKLRALTELDVGGNQLKKLPAAIGSLTALTELEVHRNPLQLPPLAVAERGLAAIRAFFKDLEAGSAIARTCMLVLLGDAEMGKTSLLNGLRNDCTPDPAPAGPDGRTIHVDIKPLSLGAGDSAVEFKCYDLGGQYKSYAAAQQAYVARGALYLRRQRRDRKQR